MHLRQRILLSSGASSRPSPGFPTVAAARGPDSARGAAPGGATRRIVESGSTTRYRSAVMAAGGALADGLAIVDAREVWHGFPSAASQVRGGEYEVVVTTQDGVTEDDLRAAVVELLAAPSLPGLRRRGESERKSDAAERDLRPYVEDLELLETVPAKRTARLRMQLRLDPSGAGRPRDVVDALGLDLRPTRTIRHRLLFVDTPPVAR